jgi:hypothetical protein
VAVAVKHSNLFDDDTRDRLCTFFQLEPLLQLPEFEDVDTTNAGTAPRMSELANALQRGTFGTADEFFAQATRMLDRIASKKADPRGDEGFLASQHRWLSHVFEKHIKSASPFTALKLQSSHIVTLLAAIERVERMSCAYWLRGSQAPWRLEPAQLAPSEQLTLASLKVFSNSVVVLLVSHVTLICRAPILAHCTSHQDRVRAGTLAHALGIMLDARRTLWEFVALDVDEKTVQNMAKRRRNDACFMLLLLYRELSASGVLPLIQFHTQLHCQSMLEFCLCSL